MKGVENKSNYHIYTLASYICYPIVIKETNIHPNITTYTTKSMVRKPEREEDMMPDTTIRTRPLVVSPFTAFGQRVETKFKDNKIIYLHPKKTNK